MSGVHDSRARAERPGLGQHLRRRQPVRRQAGVVLGHLLRQVHVQGGGATRRPPGHHRHLLGRHRAHRVHRCTDHHVLGGLVRCGECVHPCRPAVGVTVAEALLHAFERTPDTAGEVARVEQRDPQPGLPGSVDECVRHRVRVGVRHASGAVVEVVELTDRGDAGQRQLRVRRPRQPVVGVGVEPVGDCVHLLAPGPEAAGATGDDLRSCVRAARGGRRGCARRRHRAAPGRSAGSQSPAGTRPRGRRRSGSRRPRPAPLR